MKIKTVVIKTFVGILLYFIFISPFVFLSAELISPEIMLRTPLTMLFELNPFAWAIFVISEALAWIFVELK